MKFGISPLYLGYIIIVAIKILLEDISLCKKSHFLLLPLIFSSSFGLNIMINSLTDSHGFIRKFCDIQNSSMHSRATG